MQYKMWPGNYRSRVKAVGYTGLAIVVLGLFIMLLQPELVVEPIPSGVLASGVGAVLITIALIELRKIDEGEVRWDEREEMIEVKARSVAFGVILVIVVVLTILFGTMRVEASAFPVIYLLMGIICLTYVVFRYWYGREM